MTTRQIKQQITFGELFNVGLSLVGPDGMKNLPDSFLAARLRTNSSGVALRDMLAEEGVAILEEGGDSPEVIALKEQLDNLEASSRKRVAGVGRNTDIGELTKFLTANALEANEVRAEISALIGVDARIEKAITEAMLIIAPDVHLGDFVLWRQQVTQVKHFWPETNGTVILFKVTEELLVEHSLPASLLGKVALATELPPTNGGIILLVRDSLEATHDKPSTFYKEVNAYFGKPDATNGTNSTSLFQTDPGKLEIQASPDLEV